MDSQLESWVNADGKHLVCGRRLHPFCLYDIMFLEVQENPLWLRDHDITWGDLLTAILVCSTPPEQWLNPQKYNTTFRRIARFLWIAWCRKVHNLELEARKFAVYINDYYSRPEYWIDEGDMEGGNIKAPWIPSITSFIEDHTSMTEREILTASVGKMLWKSACIAEQRGMSKAEIVSDEDLEGLRALGLR